MDTEHLRTFEQIVRFGSFSKAARQLNLSQPTISGRIQALEQEVGGALLTRGGRHLELTELGASFLPYAQQALATLATGVEAAQLTRKGKRGIISIGTLQVLTEGFLASALTRYYRMYDEVGLFVRTGHTENIVSMLHDGHIKLGLISWPFFDPELTPLLHFQEPLIAVASPSHPLTKRAQIEPSDVEEEGNPFFRITWNDEVGLWQDHLSRYREKDIRIPISTVHYFLQRGMGVALLPFSFVKNDLDTGRLLKLVIHQMPSFSHEMALVCHVRDTKLSAAMKNFVYVLWEEAKRYDIPCVIRSPAHLGIVEAK